jgi:hypothetical protein
MIGEIQSSNISKEEDFWEEREKLWRKMALRNRSQVGLLMMSFRRRGWS